MRAIIRAAPFVLAAMVLVFAACRGDADDGSTPAATATHNPTAPAATTTTPAAEVTPATVDATATATTGAAGEPIGPLTIETEIDVDGVAREYRLFVPSSVREGVPAPLVIGMHGGFGNAAQFARSSGFDDEAERGGFIAVYPQGLGRVPTWNGGACCGYAARNDVDDVGFISALIDEVAAGYPVDLGRVYAVGHSNGAIMAFRLACELSDRIAAIGAVAGSLEIGSCAMEQPVSVLSIHGDADLNHPLNGGRGPQSVANVDFTSTAATMEAMRGANGCATGTTVVDEGDIVTTAWDCPPGIDVELQVIRGGSHAWPGSNQVLASGPASQAMDATAVLWTWLSGHSR